MLPVVHFPLKITTHDILVKLIVGVERIGIIVLMMPNVSV